MPNVIFNKYNIQIRENLFENASGDPAQLLLLQRVFYLLDRMSRNNHGEVCKRKDLFIRGGCWTSFFFARDVLGGEFLEGEHQIARLGGPAFFYAMRLKKERFPLGEKAISQHFQRAKDYEQTFGVNLKELHGEPSEVPW